MIMDTQHQREANEMQETGQLNQTAGKLSCNSSELPTQNVIGNPPQGSRHLSNSAIASLANSDRNLPGLQQSKHSSQSSSTSRKRYWRKFFNTFANDWWYWEIGCLVTGLCSMLAVIIILCMVSHTALKDWKFPIQPNSLVSVFITIAKSSLLLPVAECISQAKWIQFEKADYPLIRLQEYDEASRGPWGSLQLLLHLGNISWIASMGAVLTLLALALDPFTQQIIAFPSQQTVSRSGSASLAAIQDLDFVDQISMQGAILNGIYNPDILPSTVNCTTSACTWPDPVVSLGVCSSCSDLSPITNVKCETAPGPALPGVNESWAFNTTTCSYIVDNTLPFDIYMQTIHFPSTNGHKSEQASQWTRTKMSFPNTTRSLGDFLNPSRTYIIAVVSYFTSFDKDQNPLPEISLDTLAPDIVGCGLYWCGHVYANASVLNGSLSSTAPTSFFELTKVRDASGNKVSIQTNETRSDVFRVPESSSSSSSSSSTDAFPAAGTTFTIGQAAQVKLSQFIYRLFNITLSSGNEDFSVYPEADVGLDGLGDVIFREHSLPRTFERIASSMTQQVRVTGAGAVAGLAWEGETYVLVRWGWMTLPLSVLALSIAHLVATIVATNDTRRVGGRLWKSSSLALLLHGLRGWREDELRAENARQVNDIAKDMRARLQGGANDKLEFCKV